MPSFTSAVFAAMAVMQLASYTAVAKVIPCGPRDPCPACSACDGRVNGEDCCTYDETLDSTCPSVTCKIATCAGIDKCTYTNAPDRTSCGRRKKCQAGVCIVLGEEVDDPHMLGLQGQTIDWKGEDGGWYVLLSDGPDVQMSVRLTAPLSAEFPDRQLLTGFAMKYEGGHSIVIENIQPYTTETVGCPQDWFAPCLSEGALRITVDGQEISAVPSDRMALPGGNAFLTASNMPAECQPYGGDIAWSKTFSAINTAASRALFISETQTLPKWASTWAAETAAPTWCSKFLDESGVEGALAYKGKHTAFRIQTPNLTIRLHHGTNHQGGETIPDGRVLPELEFWQMNLMMEWYTLDLSTVTGLLGETARPVLDSDGVPIMVGIEAIRGNVEDYRVDGPLSDFKVNHA